MEIAAAVVLDWKRLESYASYTEICMQLCAAGECFFNET